MGLKSFLVVFLAFITGILFFTLAKADFFTANDVAHVLVGKGNYYFNVGWAGKYDLEKARRYFEKAIEADPNVPDAWHQLSRIDFSKILV